MLKTEEIIQAKWSLQLWLESLVVFERSMLYSSPIFWGIGIPKGNGTPVITVPGFLGGDTYLSDLRAFLKRAGYNPFPSEIGQNADCLQLLKERLKATVIATHERTGKKVILLSHSLGDVFAVRVCHEIPDLIIGKVSLGSPKRQITAHPLVLSAASLVREMIKIKQNGVESDCYTADCTCPTVKSVIEGKCLNIQKASIFSRFDGIVDWQCCLGEEEENIEVVSTHIGMVFNPLVFKSIAKVLSKFTENTTNA